MTDEKRIENPVKRAAIDLAHMMEYQKNVQYDNDYKRELFREEYNAFVMDLIKKGYDINTLLAYAEEYKTLTMAEYFEWRYI